MGGAIAEFTSVASSSYVCICVDYKKTPLRVDMAQYSRAWFREGAVKEGQSTIFPQTICHISVMALDLRGELS